MSDTLTESRQLTWPASNSFGQKPVDPAFAKGAAYVDGRIVPVEQATIPLLDWGFLRSDACQETISVWNGQFFRLDDHLARFGRSTGRLQMNSSPVTSDEIRDIVHRLVAVCAFDKAYVQIIMTRGFPPIGSRDLRLCKNRFQAFCFPYVWIATQDQQQKGLNVHVSKRMRVPSASVDPMVKHYHWLDFQMGLLEAYQQNTDTVLLVDSNGDVAEGPGFNVFAVVKGELATPASGVLDGMTRRTVIELARERGIAVTERAIPEAELRSADEVFLTTTAGGVIPVTSIDGTALGNGWPGEVTRELHAAYWNRRGQGWLSTPVDYSRNQIS